MFEVEIRSEKGCTVNEAQLREAALAVLSQHQVASGSSLTVVITGNDEVAALNRRYRGIDAPTDVLSFPADPPPVEIPDEPPYLGDVVIAYPYAAAQAAREKHAPDDNLALLVVHGTLHLLGYDHSTHEEKAEMWAAQAEALQALGISPDIVPALESDVHEA